MAHKFLAISQAIFYVVATLSLVVAVRNGSDCDCEKTATQ